MAEKLHLEAFGAQKFLLTATGIWPRKDSGKWYNAYGFFVSLVLQAVFIMPSFAQVFSQSTDVAHGCYILFCTLTTFTYGIKLVILYIKRRSFYEVLDDLKQPLFVHRGPFGVFIKNAALISNKTRNLIQFPCIFLIIFMAAFPSLDYSSEHSFPFDMPINIDKLPLFLYATIYFLQILTAIVCVVNNVSIDTLACSFIALGTAQLQILRENLKISVNFAVSGYESTTSKNVIENFESCIQFNRDVERNLTKCVEHQIAISRYVEKLEEMFTYMFLAQFLTSLIAICITGFSLIVIPVSNLLFGASVSYFAAAMVEICLYCLFGDELMLQSLKIDDACYMSEWNRCDTNVCKTLCIIMERSKRPLFLTAGKFAKLSRESLVTLCKSSFSYFAVLRKIYGDE